MGYPSEIHIKTKSCKIKFIHDLFLYLHNAFDILYSEAVMIGKVICEFTYASISSSSNFVSPITAILTRNNVILSF